MHKKAMRVGRNAEETRTLDTPRQVEIAFQPSFRQTHPCKNPLVALETHLCLDGGIDIGTCIGNGLCEGVKEGNDCWVAVLQVVFNRCRIADVRLPAAMKASPTGGAGPCRHR